MDRQLAKSVEDKTRIVLGVLRGEVSIDEAARPEGTSAVSVSKWHHLRRSPPAEKARNNSKTPISQLVG